MVDVKVRKLEDWVVETLRDRARRAGRSLEQELRQVLTEEALGAQRAAGGQFAALRCEMKKKHGTVSDSVPLIREDRDARG